MTELIKLDGKYWHDPVWRKVIAGAIATAIGALGIYLLGWWPAVSQALVDSYNFVFASEVIPNWLLVVLAMPWSLVLVAAGYVIRYKKRPGLPHPDWYDYTTDLFHDIKWAWRYNSEGKIIDLSSFCPDCDARIYPQPNHNFLHDFTHTSFHCKNCGRDCGNFQEGLAQFENKIAREIQRKIRDRTWSGT